MRPAARAAHGDRATAWTVQDPTEGASDAQDHHRGTRTDTGSGSVALTGGAAQARSHAGRPAALRPAGSGVQTLVLTDRIDRHANTDIDLGAPGLSAGDQQVFRDKLFQNGKRVGTSTGVAELVAVDAATITAQVVVTVTIPTGTLALQIAFVEVLADGPPPVLHGAITGGTGTYRDARGECFSRSNPGSDDSTITCRISTAG